MRILYLGWADHVHVSRWAECFAGMGHKVAVLSTRPGSIPGVTVLNFRTKNMRTSIQAKELAFHKRLFRADLIHAHWASFGYLPSYINARPYIVTAWGSDIYRLNEFDEEGRQAIISGLKGADLITADSHDLKKAIAELGVVASRIEVIQWGVDTGLFMPDLDARRLKQQLCISGGKVVYSPRGIGDVYNNDVVLKAFAEVLKEQPETTLVQKYYNCSENDVRAFSGLARELGIEKKVKLVGEMSYGDIPFLYNIADVVVSVPSVDGTPMSVLEAMACGAVPVVSDLASLREWVEEGVNGFIVPVKDPHALASRITGILRDRMIAEAFKLRNVELVRVRADHHANMKYMEKRYMELISGGARQAYGA